MSCTRSAAACAALFALVVVACGQEDPAPEVFGGEGEAAETVYDCHGVTATATELQEAPTVAELDDHPAYDAFAEHADDLEQWRAVAIEDEEISAIRELDPPDEHSGEVRDHERKVITLHDEPAPPETDEEGWMLASSGPCALRATMDGLGFAAVHLDPAAPPEEQSAQLELLVIEQACASGQDATGRVEIDVDADGEEVRLVVGVEPLGGDQACPDNPATPVTVELDEPLGDRQVVDAGRYPPQQIDTAPDTGA